jgi:hypothetical protein
MSGSLWTIRCYNPEDHTVQEVGYIHYFSNEAIFLCTVLQVDSLTVAVVGCEGVKCQKQEHRFRCCVQHSEKYVKKSAQLQIVLSILVHTIIFVSNNGESANRIRREEDVSNRWIRDKSLDLNSGGDAPDSRQEFRISWLVFLSPSREIPG